MNRPGGAGPARRGGERLGGGRRQLVDSRADSAVDRPPGPLVLGRVRPQARDPGGESDNLAVGGLRRVLLDLATDPESVRRVMKRLVLLGVVTLLVAALPVVPRG